MNLGQTGADTFQTVEEFYRAGKNMAAGGLSVRSLFALRHWFHAAVTFDNLTGEAQPESLGTLCERLQSPEQWPSAQTCCKDRLHRIVSHVRQPIAELFRGLGERQLRERVMLPLQNVREVDSICLMAVSRRPGRTVREKLAGNPRLLAVLRRASTDTAENRLLKAFCLRLEELLAAHGDCFGDCETTENIEMRNAIGGWLLSPETDEIGRWENPPPNNVLLQHRNYRRILTAWRWLQSLDSDMRRDFEDRHRLWVTVLFWAIVVRLYKSPSAHLPEQPCFINYEDFDIRPCLSRDHADELASVEGLLVSRRIRRFRIVLLADFKIAWTFKDEGTQILATRVSAGDNWMSVAARNFIFNAPPDPHGAYETAARVVAKLLPGYQMPVSVPPIAVRRAQHATVDLAALRPRYADENGPTMLPSRLLWQLWQLPEQDSVAIDLGQSRTVALHPFATTVSVLDLLAAKQDQRLAPGTLSQAAKAFAERIAAYAAPQALTYLVPDAADDFSLETIRTSLNARFPGAQPLPRSIAAVFEWQASRAFATSDVRAGDCVIVLDAAGDDFSATPVLASFDPTLAERVPASRGIYWERCPAAQGAPDCSSVLLAASALSTSGCSISDAVGRLCGLQGLFDEQSDLCWVDSEGKWFLPPPELPRRCEDAKASVRDVWRELEDGLLPTLRYLPDRSRVLILGVGDVDEVAIGRPPDDQLGGRDAIRLPHAQHLAHGGILLMRWQQAAGDIALWRDHLPELRMRVVRDGGFAHFPLVKDVTVTPKLGVAVSIPIKEGFTLPAGLSHYQFPLLLGTEGTALRYEAFLRSPAFPLKEKVPCQLVMSFTYGANQPYQLEFVPLAPGSAGFASVRVEWRRSDLPTGSDLTRMAAPAYPPRKTWADFQKYPKEDGNDVSDLLEWVTSKLSLLDPNNAYEQRLRRAVERETDLARKNRVSGLFEWGAQDKNGNYYCRVNVGGESVFCHSADFVEPIDVEDLSEGQIVYLTVVMNKRGQKCGINISFPEEFPLVMAKRIEDHLRGTLRHDTAKWLQSQSEYLSHAMRTLRFPILTIWKDGHSLAEPDVPDGFRMALRDGVDRALEILNSEDASTELKDELFFMLCCLHRDAPPAAIQILLDVCKGLPVSADAFWRLYRHIGLAIGDVSLPWQEELYKTIIATLNADDPKLRSTSLCALAVGLWRHPQLFDRLQTIELCVILRRILEALRYDGNRLDGEHKKYHEVVANTHLELLLGLLRTRGSDKPEIRTLLAPDQPRTEQLWHAVETLEEIILRNGILMNSRVRLDVNMPTELFNTPKLLYALRLYLTGDAAAGLIQVTGVGDDD